LFIYFYCEGSPTGVSWFASIDISKAKQLCASRKIDALDLALANIWE
jgi:hypothetical protein